VDARLDEIVDFADIGPFLDTPVKFYSSGMFVRLGFAVAVQARPDVLLVDEVLAVGDLSFQNKCYYKMQEIREAGTTVVVVSHNLLAIRRLCDRVVVMHAGSVRFDGEPGPAISRLHELLDEEPLAGPDGMSGRLPLEAGVVEGTSLEVIGDGRDGASYVASGDRLRLRFTMRAAQPVPHPVYHINVHNAEGSWVYGDTTRFLQMPALPAGEPTSVDIELAPSLVTGSYTVRVGVHRGDADGDALARLAVSQPVTFYVAGRHRAMGVADLQASFTASDREPSS
jgi:ABC-2 type transport system ATP-binding protein